MINLRRIFKVGLIGLTFSLLIGCGTAHKTDDCSNCVPPQPPICVAAYGSLWCADSCISHAGCELGFSCMALEDQDNPGIIRGVCMEDSLRPTDVGRVHYWGQSNCVSSGSDPCPGGMQCTQSTASPYDYFCSDICDYDDECVTGCCEGTYCAPYYPFCN